MLSVLFLLSLTLSRENGMPVTRAVALEMFDEILVPIFGANPQSQNAFVEHALNQNPQKSAVAILCQSSKTLKINLGMHTNPHIWCDGSEMTPHKEKMFERANARIVQLLSEATTRRGTVMML